MPPRRYSETFSQTFGLARTAAWSLKAFEVEVAARLGAAVTPDAVFFDDGPHAVEGWLGGRRRSDAATPARRRRQPQDAPQKGMSADASFHPFLRTRRVGQASELHRREGRDDCTETIIGYKRMIFKRRVISSAGISSPRPRTGADLTGLAATPRGRRRCSPRTARCGTAAAGRGRRCNRHFCRRRRNRRWPSRAGCGRAASTGSINPELRRGFRRGVRRWRRGRRRPPRHSRVRRCSSGRIGCR